MSNEMSKSELVSSAMSGSVNAIYDLMLRFPDAPEIKLLKSALSSKISEEIDLISPGAISVYSLRDYLRGDTDIDGRVLMYFDGEPVVPVKISGEVVLSDEQFSIIESSVIRDQMEQFSEKEYYGKAGNFIYAPDIDAYIEYLDGFKEFKNLLKACPRYIIKEIASPIVHDLLYERVPTVEAYEFNSIRFVSVPKKMDKLDFISVSQDSVSCMRSMLAVSDDLIITNFGFINCQSKGVVVRDKAGQGVLDRVTVSPI